MHIKRIQRGQLCEELKLPLFLGILLGVFSQNYIFIPCLIITLTKEIKMIKAHQCLPFDVYFSRRPQSDRFISESALVRRLLRPINYVASNF